MSEEVTTGAKGPPRPRRTAAKAAIPTPATLIKRFQATQEFPLDEFQLESMRVLAAGRSVLVSAPTGSGKTVVAEFAIFMARAHGKRCIYTTPLKALSNQKFRDLRGIMGDEVGLVTGDVVINPNAPVLIMTTEILRNMLQMDPERVDDVLHVILDEAHYIGSDGRGTVWEETIVFLGKMTSIVALSATIPNADELADWVSSVHKPMDVVFHDFRPVPLEPFIALPRVEPLFDKRRKLRIRTFKKDGDWLESVLSSQVVIDLHKKSMLPAIFFVFSRLGCEREAVEVLRSGIQLTSPAERAEIEAAVKEAITLTPGLLTSNTTRGWLDKLPFGVAPHHAGLLPPLKLLIEILFQRNLLKVVFATETLAAGINMPARTVVITSLVKRTDEGNRSLTVSEFAQMTGRAGRRGMDTVGYGVVLASHRYEPQQVATLFLGQSEPLRSRFTLNYNMVINLAHRYEPAQARRIVEQCFSQFQNNQTIQDLAALQPNVQEKLDTKEMACPRFPTEFQRADVLGRHAHARKAREDAKAELASLDKQLRGAGVKDLQRLVLAAPRNTWVVVKRQHEPEPELALLLDKFPRKKDVQFAALLSGGRVVLLASRDLVVSLGVPGPKPAPDPAMAKEADAMSYNQIRRYRQLGESWADWVEDAGLDADALCRVPDEPAAVAVARDAMVQASEAFESTTCYNCNQWKERCVPEEKEVNRLKRDNAAYQEQIEAIRGKYWRQFQKLQELLTAGKYIRGRELLPRGVALANLRTSNELIAAEVLASGLLEDLNAEELAAVTSGIVAEPVRGRMAWRPVRPSPRVSQAIDDIVDIAIGMDKLQEKLKIDDQPIYVAGEYAGMVQAWACMASWAHVTEISGIDEGQLVRHLRQVIDMLNQFKDIPGTSKAFQENALAAAALVDRDIVKEVF